MRSIWRTSANQLSTRQKVLRTKFPMFFQTPKNSFNRPRTLSLVTRLTWRFVLLINFVRIFHVESGNVWLKSEFLISPVLLFNYFAPLGSAALSTNGVKPRTTPNFSNLSFVLKYKDDNISVPMDQPEKLWALKEFDVNLPLVVMVTGWTTNFNDSSIPTLDGIYRAYRCRGGVNFVVSFRWNIHLFILFFIVFIDGRVDSWSVIVHRYIVLVVSAEHRGNWLFYCSRIATFNNKLSHR